MYGSPKNFWPRGGQGPPIGSLADFLPENFNFSPYASSSNSPYWQRANSNFQNPRFYSPQFPQNGNYRNQSQHFSIEEVESAVVKAHKDLLESGENVSVWKISQSVARSLKVSSWEALGFRTVDAPTLRDLQPIEGKVNAFIHCFVHTRKMTSIYELGLDICKNEGVDKFDELRLGPLLRQPLVRAYFSVSPDAHEICEITTEGLVSHLSAFLHEKRKEEIKLEEFLDFLVLKCSVASRGHLGVRIRSMGLFIKYIKAGRRAENAVVKSIQERGLPKEEPEMPSQSIPSDLKLTSLIDDESGDHCEQFVPLDDVDYADNSINREARKQEPSDYNNESHFNDANLSEKELHMVTQLDDDEIIVGNEKKPIRRGAAEVTSFDLTDKEIERFVTTWKVASKKCPVDEVLSLMIKRYSPGSSDKKKRKLRNNFSSYPAIGLLNVAVRFMKAEFLIQALDQHGSLEENSTRSTKIFKIEPSTEIKLALDDDNCTKAVEQGALVSAEDIIKQICNFIEPDPILSGRGIPLEKQLVLRACEMWLRLQFSVKEFQCLNHGNFFEFVDEYASHLPHDKRYLLARDISKKSVWEISMHQKQFLVLLLQAVGNTDKEVAISQEDIFILLRKQFPLIGLMVKINDFDGKLSDIINCQEKNIASSAVFSATLLGNFCRGSLFSQSEKFGESSSVVTEREIPFGSLGPVSATEAIECLLKAPMLSELQSWSHWDHVFAPALGPLWEWLLNQGSIEELSCIITSDGRIIRIDHLATPDEFLEASIQGSSFQAALKLLSLLQIYGGSCKAPVSLLKCYFQQAVVVVTKNFANHIEASANSSQTIPLQRSFFTQQIKSAAENDWSIVPKNLSKMSEIGGGRNLFSEISQMSKAYSYISVFILDCLGHLPSEFHSFAADILVSGMQFSSRNAVTIILNECRHVHERIMLHEIGLSLGIMEWINDYKDFLSKIDAHMSEPLGTQGRGFEECAIPELSNHLPGVFEKILSSDGKAHKNIETPLQKSGLPQATVCESFCKELSTELMYTSTQLENKDFQFRDAAALIEQIRREDFGLDPDTADTDLLKKQHARLGRALNCLSQELYSQDSHIILELIQNADDNSYPENVEPTLVFILQENGVIILNNEVGFSAQNMRALCDVGNSTKKGSSGGYIGQKGIGFKSVFRVTDAPEIHSNGFHVKFDINDGQIGFVLPTIIPPCDIDLFRRQMMCDFDQPHATFWNSCIVLPFKPELKRGKGMSRILSMFSDIHPHLLLFLRHLKCIRYKNMISNELVVFRRESDENGMVTISIGKNKMSWLLVNRNLKPALIRPEVQTTKITLAFPLEESEMSKYKAKLDQQHVFAFLPLRKYGLKFILQCDFILPSSREEVDGNSAWNQYLLSRIPELFVSAEESFCALPCFQDNLGKAVTTFMSFVPLMGEVHGFFSDLPRMISKELRKSKCLLLDGSSVEWVPPCRVLQNCDEQLRNFLPNSLLQQHLGLGYLHRDIFLHDSLAKELDIQEYGSEFLVELQSSACRSGGTSLLNLEWLSCWLNALCISISSNASKNLASANTEMEFNLVKKLKGISFIPLSDDSYVSVAEGPVWLPCDVSTLKHESGNVLKHLPVFYSNLRTVTPLLFSTKFAEGSNFEENRVSNIIRILLKIGVRQLSSHDIIKNHIFPSISYGRISDVSTDLMTEYLFYIMTHLQSACSSCDTERRDIISELQRQSIISTNHGYICPIEKPIHFSKEFGNPCDMKKLIDDIDIEWNELDHSYLQHPSTQSLSNGLNKWREFFLELGITDFVQVRRVEKSAKEVLDMDSKSMPVYGDAIDGEIIIEDWESPELVSLLSALSTKKHLDKFKYLLEVFDKMWDDFYILKSTCYNPFQCGVQLKNFESSFMRCIRKFKWVASSIDDELHCPEDLFYNCKAVQSILGNAAPYAVPKASSRRFVQDIGLKVQVTLDDAIRVLQLWRTSKTFASIFQMNKIYTFVQEELTKSKEKIANVKSDIAIFVPSVCKSENKDIVPGTFMLPDKLCWHDATGCVGRLRELTHSHDSTSATKLPTCLTLSILYPGLHDFLVTDCGVPEAPSFIGYLLILRHLSYVGLPSEVAHEVFRVFLKWADDLKSGLFSCDEINDLKCFLLKLENTVLPTIQDTWVSLNPTFGTVCWTDDDERMEQFKDVNDVHILQFGELTTNEREMLCEKVSIFMKNIGIPALAEVISREAISYGIADDNYEASLISWILPYAQRYLYKMHPDLYLHLKELEFAKTINLQVFVVEKLYYKNSIKGRDSSNAKRFECNCLLEGNIFYITPNTDSHELFLELSRLFFHGLSNLHIANFLHIITTKAELGHIEEQIEHFIVGSYHVPVLPEGEPLWAFSVLADLNYAEDTSHLKAKQQYTKLATNQFSKLCWPPVNLKASVGLPSASDTFPKKIPVPAFIHFDDVPVPIDGVVQTALESARSNKNKDILCLKTLEGQSYKTGRLGEMIVYRYFTEKLSEAAVQWVNRDFEMGLPYDLIIKKKSETVYVEVKSTISTSKNWFPISKNEWQCAIEKEESFIIARVILCSQTNAKIGILKNPVKLCQQNVLQLALIQSPNSVNLAEVPLYD
ncbi:hypothetical protein IEQ34_022521 [Dendrobium chrysotoxum]|uniref:Protein NO VEIN C-terminal domain-containing protein n=1 Tax=Dendrobium chrysotoxum TaxID=161865 RepID=A0AAV7FXH3_DENCH|nr:hypothetical protein IEQ34_022521 [Dendrobium chrysotoxum]